jgi:hypothetical protein
MNPPTWPKPVTMTNSPTRRRGEGPLQSRKKLLLAERELNRAQLVQECRTLADEGRALKESARDISAIATAVATLVAGLAALRRKKCPPAAAKPSWLQTILQGAGVVSALWSEFRAGPKA